MSTDDDPRRLSQVDFSAAEFAAFGVDDLRTSSYIKTVGDGGVVKYFQPGMPPPARSTKLPDSAMTSLGEIRFGRKDVQAMNVLMCRKLVAALYQVTARS